MVDIAAKLAAVATQKARDKAVTLWGLDDHRPEQAMNFSRQLVEHAAAHKSEISRQLVEQRFGLLQDRSVEAFGEPAVNWREESTGVGALALVAPEAGEAGGGAQFKQLCPLSLRNRDRLVITLLGCSSIAGGIQQIAPQIRSSVVSVMPVASAKQFRASTCRLISE